MAIQDILNHLDAHEIDFRLESNFCCSYIFYFLDGSVYPRRYYDHALEGNKETIVAETVEHLITKAISNELVKDWRHRIEAESLESLFKLVEDYLIERGAKFKVSNANEPIESKTKACTNMVVIGRSELLVCPFCNEDNFDKVGLKYHIANYCVEYGQTNSL